MPEIVGGIPLILNTGETEGEPLVPGFHLVRGQRVPLKLSDRSQPGEKTLPLYHAGTPEMGDSADIRGGSSWSEGIWSLELSRPLQTPSTRDVKLDPVKKSHTFGLAVWDGTAGDQHHVATMIGLRFEPVQGAK